MSISFGAYVLSARKEKKLSQAELAKTAALSQTYLSELERGIASPSREAAQAIANALTLDTDRTLRLAGYITASDAAIIEEMERIPEAEQIVRLYSGADPRERNISRELLNQFNHRKEKEADGDPA